MGRRAVDLRKILMQNSSFKNKRKPWGSVYGIQRKKGLTTRTTLKSHKQLKAKKSINKVGKVGRANKTARGLIADYAKAMDLKSCEIGPLGLTTGCTKTWPVAPAHRHKRAWYKGDAVLLASPKQWVVACQCCHDQIEFNAELTEEVFIKLRGAE
jgi:hypothetical protein